jgi:AraC-like DNA-binding protein
VHLGKIDAEWRAILPQVANLQQSGGPNLASSAPQRGVNLAAQFIFPRLPHLPFPIVIVITKDNVALACAWHCGEQQTRLSQPTVPAGLGGVAANEVPGQGRGHSTNFRALDHFVGCGTHFLPSRTFLYCIRPILRVRRLRRATDRHERPRLIRESRLRAECSRARPGPQQGHETVGGDQSPRAAMDPRVTTVLALLETRMDWQIDALAASVNLSRSRLRHLFRVEMSMSLYRHLKERRLVRAEQLLRTTFLSVKPDITKSQLARIESQVLPLLDHDFALDSNRIAILRRRPTSQPFETTGLLSERGCLAPRAAFWVPTSPCERRTRGATGQLRPALAHCRAIEVGIGRGARDKARDLADAEPGFSVNVSPCTTRT